MSGTLQVAGALLASAAAAAVILSGDRRLRAAAMGAALALSVALLAGQAWDGQLATLRASPAKLLAVGLAAAAVVAGLAALAERRPELLPLGLLAMLPFRIPVDAGGETSNLLLPLYAVIAAGVVVECRRAFAAGAAGGPRSAPGGPARWLALALAVAVLLYALQASYSSDVERAAQNIAFFFVPFALMFAILRDTRWTPELLRWALYVLVAEGVVFALIGIVQHQSHHIFWNGKAMESNEFDLNFRVNSLFWDPNIYGRYLALTAVVATAALLWVKDARRFALGAVAVAVIFLGLALAYSQTSYFALIAGLVALAALRWSWRWTALACLAAALAGVIVAVFFSSGTIEVGSGSGSALDQTTSGRSRLARGGLDLARDRPLAGYGSGSFAVEFSKRNQVAQSEAAVSHTEPITVAAEQGAVGIAAYLALLAAALALLLAGMRQIAPGLGGSFPGGAVAGARLAIAAAFAALLVHTIGYAGFLTDPLTWALLALASALAARDRS
jgi:O-antigen ligase